ncbi:nitroreductase family protein [Nocardioides mesophilus]|uniref:Nitroreductase family protein n=1 Tax=Nocardioides mesophilus TaxID=433659 RepID=A0A7G9RF49_9ACTN|nr:nitroreductase family protein [Nocardioides mesophilus]QNN54224.1 nitroreductase family protein [Nocardioides mesophilus]
MEFQEVVRRRRMIRSYDPDRPVDPAVVDRMLDNAVRAPSAGFSQGWAFLVLDTAADVERFWAATTAPGAGEPDSWLRGMRTAPVIIVPLSCKQVYLDRYAQDDKGWTDRDEARWPVPYWDIDTGMASLLILQTAVDEGLGACFFGVPPDRIAAFRETFGVPAAYTPIGAVTVGHRVTDPGAAGSPKRRARRPAEEVVHRGSW